jgi:hypothetical protein
MSENVRPSSRCVPETWKFVKIHFSGFGVYQELGRPHYRLRLSERDKPGMTPRRTFSKWKVL